MTADSPMAAFQASAPPDVAAAAAADPGFGAALSDAVSAARGAHADLAVSASGFVSHLAARMTDAELGKLVIPDLYLAYACLEGDPVAIELFLAAYGPDIEQAGGKVRTPDFEAMVHEQLFVRPGKLGQYAGRGDLRGWLRVVLSRLVVDLMRRSGVRPEERPTTPEDLLDLAADGEPELRFLEEKYREPVRIALEGAFADLTPRDRNLLRLRALEGHNCDQIGARYGIHRTSAARWIGQAQRALLQATRVRLRDEFGIAEEEFTSVARLVQSRLHLSLHRILSSTLEPEPGSPKK